MQREVDMVLLFITLGECNYANDDKYKGEWRNDMKHGKGN